MVNATETEEVRRLKSLDFTGTESRLYAALSRYGPMTGYEVAQRSGVPRANVYPVLARLVERGALRKVPSFRTMQFEAVPMTVFIEERVRQMRSAAKELEPLLEQERSRRESQVSAGRGLEAFDQAVHALVERAGETLHLAVGPREARRIGSAVEEARNRLGDVQTACFSGCPTPCPVCGPNAHSLADGSLSHGLVLCRDREEILILDDADGEASFVVVRSPALGAGIVAAVENAPRLQH